MTFRCPKWKRIFSARFNVFLDLTLPILTWLWIWFTWSVTGATSGAEHAYPSGAPDVTSGFHESSHYKCLGSKCCVFFYFLALLLCRVFVFSLLFCVFKYLFWFTRFPWICLVFFGFLVFSYLFFGFPMVFLCFRPWRFYSLLVSKFSSPWRPYGATLWQDSSCRAFRRASTYSLFMFNFPEHVADI